MICINENFDEKALQNIKNEKKLFGDSHKNLTTDLYRISKITNETTFNKIQQYCAFHPDDTKYVVYLFENYPSIARNKTISWHYKCFLVKAFENTNVSLTKYSNELLNAALQKCQNLKQAKAVIKLFSKTNPFNRKRVMNNLLNHNDFNNLLDTAYMGENYLNSLFNHLNNRNITTGFSEIFFDQVNDPLLYTVPSDLIAEENEKPKYDFSHNPILQKYPLDKLTDENKIAIENFIIAKGFTNNIHSFLTFCLESCKTNQDFDNNKLKDMLNNEFLLNNIDQINNKYQFNNVHNGFKNLVRFSKSEKYVVYKKTILDLIKSFKNESDKIKMVSLCDSPENIQIMIKIYEACGSINFNNMTSEKLEATFIAFNSFFDTTLEITQKKEFLNYRTDALKNLLKLANDENTTVNDIINFRTIHLIEDNNQQETPNYINPIFYTTGYINDDNKVMSPLEMTNMYIKHLEYTSHIKPNEYEQSIFTKLGIENVPQSMLQKYRNRTLSDIFTKQNTMLYNQNLDQETRKFIINNPNFALFLSDNINNMQDINTAKNIFNTFISNLTQETPLNVDTIYNNLFSNFDTKSTKEILCKIINQIDTIKDLNQQQIANPAR